MEGEWRRAFLFCAFLVLCREASCDDTAAEVSVRELYIKVMNDVKMKYNAGDLEQKNGVVAVITETQNLLGKFSLRVLGLEVGDRSFVEIQQVLKQWNESGNMTNEQDKGMQDLAIDTQVRIIQGLFKVFGFSAEKAAEEYDWPLPAMRLLLQRPTFQPDRSAEEEKAFQEEHEETNLPNLEGESNTEDLILEAFNMDSEIENVTCESSHEKCADGTCIPSRWLCDGEHDCADGSDESNCSFSESRRPQCDLDNQRQCDNGACLQKDTWCDGTVDCFDGSDEGVGCPQVEQSTENYTLVSQ